LNNACGGVRLSVGLVKEACVPGVLTAGGTEEGITTEMREMCSSEGKDLLTSHVQGPD